MPVCAWDGSCHQRADATFSGDRILVSKFAYALADSARWDVAVFKFPGNPKQNYIKRIVGLPDETLMIHHGDIYAQSVIWSIILVTYVVMAARGVSVGEDPLGLATGVVQFVALLIICFGAAQMGHLKSFRMARIAAALSCILGLTPFFILDIPFGIWSLVLLRDATIRSEFTTTLASEVSG